MALLDLLGRRWTLRIVWELRDRPLRFRELQDAIGASPTIVNSRLAELRRARLVELDDETGYCLTSLGSELGGDVVRRVAGTAIALDGFEIGPRLEGGGFVGQLVGHRLGADGGDAHAQGRDGEDGKRQEDRAFHRSSPHAAVTVTVSTTLRR
jgi:DNA-binding transcriptional ArsR family regulator